MTTPWVAADTEIWDFDSADDFIWYPDSTTSLTWNLIGDFEVCSPESGRINSGAIESTFVSDNNKFILNELNNTPGFCYLFKHLSVPDPSASYFLQFRGTYGGSDDHDVVFQAYNWDTTAYTTFMTLNNSLFTEDYFANIPAGASYFNGSNLKIRTLHSDPGNAGHLFRINFWELHSGSI